MQKATIQDRLVGSFGWLIYYETMLAREQKHGPPRRGFVEGVQHWEARHAAVKAEHVAALAEERLVWALEPSP